jgi:hypothetical protein
MLTPEQSYIKSVWKQGVNRILLNFDFNFVFIKNYFFIFSDCFELLILKIIFLK